MYLRKPSVEILAIDNDYSFAVDKIANAVAACYRMTPPETLEQKENYVFKRMQSKHESILEHHSITVKMIMNRGCSHEVVRHRLCAFTQESTRYANYSKDRFGNQCTFILPWWILEDKFYLDYLNSISTANDNIFEINYEDFLKSIIDHTLDIDYTYRSCNDTVQTINYLLSSNLQVVEGKEKHYLIYNWLLGLFFSEKQYMSLLDITKRPELARGLLPNDLSTMIYHTADIREWRHILKLRSLGTTGRPHPDIKLIMDVLRDKLVKEYPVFFKDLKESHDEATN